MMVLNKSSKTTKFPFPMMAGQASLTGPHIFQALSTQSHAVRIPPTAGLPGVNGKAFKK